MTDKPLPDVGAEPYASAFWEGARNGVLRLQHCRACDRRQYFPRPCCQYCGSEDLDWTDSTGEGQVHSFTVVRRPVTLPSFESETPYAVGYVDLADGPRVCTRFVNCDPSKLEIGLPVEVTFVQHGDDLTIPVFEPAPE